MASKPSFEDRFQDFLDQLDGAESIDDSLSDTELSHGKRADFLLDQRRIVLEVKSLEADPEYKIKERLAPHQERPEFPIFFWKADLNEILPYLPDGEEIRRQIFHAVTRAVQGALEKADDQIAATKTALNLEHACGVVAILNEEVGILAPDLVTAKASEMLLKTKDNDIRYKHIAYVWIISESHILVSKDGSEHLPVMILLEGPVVDDYATAGEYLDSALLKWTEFEGYQSLSWGRIQNFDGLKFKKQAAELKDDEKRLPVRHEMWRRAYRRRPYLRSLSETEFLEYFAEITTTMMPHFLIGGQKLPHAKVAELMERWTHILEEAEYRRLDVRKLESRMPPVGPPDKTKATQALNDQRTIHPG